jgi:plasmid stabilization system protein ParE
MTVRTLRYARQFYEDLERHYTHLAQLDPSLGERAYEAIHKAMRVLEDFPFIGRKAIEGDALARELLVPFGSWGYVILYDINDDVTVTILAIRHQREDDYH